MILEAIRKVAGEEFEPEPSKNNNNSNKIKWNAFKKINTKTLWTRKDSKKNLWIKLKMMGKKSTYSKNIYFIRLSKKLILWWQN